MRIQPIHKRRWIQLDQNGMFVGEALYHVSDCLYPTHIPACWSGDETRALLGVWGAANAQSKLDGVAQNKVSSRRSLPQSRTLSSPIDAALLAKSPSKNK